MHLKKILHLAIIVSTALLFIPASAHANETNKLPVIQPTDLKNLSSSNCIAWGYLQTDRIRNLGDEGFYFVETSNIRLRKGILIPRKSKIMVEFQSIDSIKSVHSKVSMPGEDLEFFYSILPPDEYQLNIKLDFSDVHYSASTMESFACGGGQAVFVGDLHMATLGKDSISRNRILNTGNFAFRSKLFRAIVPSFRGEIIDAHLGLPAFWRVKLKEDADKKAKNTGRDIDLELLKAVKFGNAEQVTTLLGKGADPSIRDQGNGFTPLMLASQNCYPRIIEELLSKGADLHATNTWGTTALMIAADKCTRGCMEYLIKKGANIDAADQDGLTALMVASIVGKPENTQFLLTAGADINLQDGEGNTALILAAINGFERVVDVLLSNAAQTEARTSEGLTALMIAALTGPDAVVRSLIAHRASVNATDPGGNTPLMLAAQSGRQSVVSLLLEAAAKIDLRNNDGATALALAAQNGSLECVNVLLARGANPAVTANDGSSPLFWAAENGHATILAALADAGVSRESKRRTVTPIWVAARNGHLDVINYLAESGTDINCPNGLGETPLMAAALKGRVEVVKILLDSKADCSTRNELGQTVLGMAKGSPNSQKKIIKLLQKNACSDR